MPQKPGKAFIFAIVLWMVGFAWGSIVYALPQLKATAPIPFISSNPWISFPILLVWLPVSFLLANSYLRTELKPGTEGFKLGFVFAIVNLALDLLVLVVLFNAGLQYFASLTVFAGYALLWVVPWMVGRARQARLSLI